MPFILNSADHKVVPCVVNDQPVSLPESANFPITQASTDEIIHYAQTADIDTANTACDAASAAFKIWSRKTVQERRDVIDKFADILASRHEDAEDRKMMETSAPAYHAKFDVGHASGFAREIAGAAMSVCKGDVMPNGGAGGPETMSFVFKEAVGPVLIIPPWNGAVVLPVRGICNALAAGCTVVMKASELCPWTHQIILECFQEAGLPAGALNQVQASRDKAAEVTEALISHPAIRKIEFIGSVPVGRIIGQLAAKHLKPTIMELGDQSPLIVCEDADLEQAAKSVAFSSNSLHGQICFSTERILVHSSVYSGFSAALKAAFETVPKFLPPGSAVSSVSLQNAKSLIDEAIADGAEFLVGDAEPTGPTSLKPSILVDVKPSSRIANGELFGPSAVLETFETEEQAIQLANAKAGGLSASVYTKSWETGLRMSRELEFGQVGINAHTQYSASHLPINCWKGSGWGSSGGQYGIEEFLHRKTVSLHNSASSAGLPF